MDILFGQDRFLDLKFCILDDVFRNCYQTYFVNHFYWTDALAADKIAHHFGKTGGRLKTQSFSHES